jgi:hypothetical protein
MKKEKGKMKKEKGEKAAGCRVAPRQRSCIEAPGGHSPIAPETGASIRPDESGLLGNRLLPAGPSKIPEGFLKIPPIHWGGMETTSNVKMSRRDI